MTGAAVALLMIAGCAGAPGRDAGVAAAERTSAAPTRVAGPRLDRLLLLNESKGKPEGPEIHQEFQRSIRAAIAATTTWPDVDLFDQYAR